MARLEVDGSKSIYYEHFAGDGPAVVLVHGWGMSCRVWDVTVGALLAAGHEVVTLDERCCGHSDKDFDEVTVAAVAGDVQKLIAATGVADPVVVGWSFGSAVTAQAAIDDSSGWRGMVLVGPPTPRYTQADGYPHGGTAEIMEQTLTALRDGRPQFLHDLTAGVFHADVGTPTIEWMWQIFLQTSPRADAGLADLGQIDHREQLPSVTVPTLICSGDHDQVVDPEIHHRCAELLPNAQLLRFAGSGHAPFLDEREAFNEALLAFVKDPSAVPAGAA